MRCKIVRIAIYLIRATERDAAMLMVSKKCFRYQVIPADDDKPVWCGLTHMGEFSNMYELHNVMRPLLGNVPLLQRAVLVDGRHVHMFADNLASLKYYPRNERATAISRAEYLAKHPEDNPECLPFISGDAVLFDDEVHFF